MRLGDDVLMVLSECRTEGEIVYLPGRQLDRRLYERVNKALEALGGKWNRKAKGHVFAHDPEARLDDAILTGSIEVQDYEFFPSSPTVVREALQLAVPDFGSVTWRGLEPSAGQGAFATRLAAHVGELVMVEIDPVNVAKLMTVAWNALYGIPATVWSGDFLQTSAAELGGAFDLIAMNPPFSRGQEIDHVTHAYGMLKPGGVLVSVMSAGVTFRQDRRYRSFRETLGPLIAPLPARSFKVAGTEVATVLVKLRKAADTTREEAVA